MKTIPTALGDLIRSRREDLGLSQTTLAERLNKKQSTVSAWETGENGVRMADLPALARELKFTAEQFASAMSIGTGDAAAVA